MGVPLGSRGVEDPVHVWKLLERESGGPVKLARRVFFEDTRISQPYKIENAVYCLISLGDEESPGLVVKAINMSGQKAMAELQSSSA